MLVEHHVPYSGVGAAKAGMAYHGYRLIINPATCTENGTHGGTMVGAKVHLPVSPLQAGGADMSIEHDFVKATLRTKATSVLICSCIWIATLG